MGTYQTKLKNRRAEARDTMSFIFEKPHDLSYKAGQFAEFTLIDPPETDGEGNVRAFTISSAPYENVIMFTTRLRDSAFKRVMQKIPLGTSVTINAPFGSFTLHNNQNVPAVFLTGGIGITPARSIILQATKDKLGHKLYLFSCNHTPETTAFLEEMTALENQNFKFIPVMTSMETWKGQKRHIDHAMLSKYIPDLKAPIYYLAGSASTVQGMRKTLNEVGINDDNIRIEEFPGY